MHPVYALYVPGIETRVPHTLLPGPQLWVGLDESTMAATAYLPVLIAVLLGSFSGKNNHVL